MTVLIVVLVLLVGLLAWAVGLYNRLVRLRNMVKEGWSGIEVQLKRRANLIPNLIQTVKGYMDHERGVLEKLTELRSRTLQTAQPAERARLEGDLSRAIGRLFAVAEAYPDLKANQNFKDLQDELSQIEDQIQMARRYYNGTVRDLNIAVESFPSNIVAGMFGFHQAEFFEIEDEADRAVPKVDF
ncbi:MAG: LemA family protein [Desulfobacterales bacterium]|jgi:LemA protein|nr:LemA family protein [Desulfobacteraceae bacterium]MDY0312588.1 LemA family protein [Desulfobacterales bacterium]